MPPPPKKKVAYIKLETCPIDANGRLNNYILNGVIKLKRKSEAVSQRERDALTPRKMLRDESNPAA